MNLISVKDMKPGQKGRIAELKAQGTLGRKIAEMGVTRGEILVVERIAPMGDPIDIRVKGYHLSLRKEDAAGIHVELA